MAGFPEVLTAELTLHTEGLIIRGAIRSRHRRLAEILNRADSAFLEVDEVTMDEHGSRGQPVLAPFVQVRIETILFAIADLPGDEDAGEAAAHGSVLLAVPPFAIAGQVDALAPDQDLRDALGTFPSEFVTVRNASYWSEPLGEARRRARTLVVNGARVQVVAPHREVDPWAGLDHVRMAAAPDDGDRVHPAAAPTDDLEPAEEA